MSKVSVVRTAVKSLEIANFAQTNAVAMAHVHLGSASAILGGVAKDVILKKESHALKIVISKAYAITMVNVIVTLG